MKMDMYVWRLMMNSRKVSAYIFIFLLSFSIGGIGLSSMGNNDNITVKYISGYKIVKEVCDLNQTCMYTPASFEDRICMDETKSDCILPASITRDYMLEKCILLDSIDSETYRCLDFIVEVVYDE